jgi:potassium-transporting ATPase potassium-binding subunit
MRWLQYIVFLLIVVGLAPPVGLYLARVCQRERTFIDPLLSPIESLLHRLLGVRPEQEMPAGVYVGCFFLFGVESSVLLFIVLSEFFTRRICVDACPVDRIGMIP